MCEDIAGYGTAWEDIVEYCRGWWSVAKYG